MWITTQGTTLISLILLFPLRENLEVACALHEQMNNIAETDESIKEEALFQQADVNVESPDSLRINLIMVKNL